MNAMAFYGFGGSYAVALKNTSVHLDAIIEPGGFGLPVVLANRDWLGFNGTVHKELPSLELAQSLASEGSVDILLGNPPCSGFSMLNQIKNHRMSRGPLSAINQCMWDIVEFASVLKPQVVVFESVPAAYTNGRSLMFDLHEYLETHTGMSWHLQLVLMSAASVGGAQRRHRFFWVASQMPIGVVIPNLSEVVAVHEAIGDLADTPLDDRLQLIVPGPEISSYAHGLRSFDDVVDGHVTTLSPKFQELIPHMQTGKGQRDSVASMVSHSTYGDYWTAERSAKYLAGSSFSGPFRLHPDGLGRVVAGDGTSAFVHYDLNRLLTIRELARLMGFPDEFSWGPQTGSFSKRNAWLGKQVPVQSWTWMLDSIVRSLNREQGLWYGVTGESGSKVIDITHDYKAVYHERRRLKGVDSRSADWKRHMASRVLS